MDLKNSFAAPYPLEQMLAAPLDGRMIGPADSNFVLAEYTDPGHPESSMEMPFYIAPFHVHHSDDEAWYVVGGKLGFRLGDDIIEAPTASAVFVPRGTPHTFWNPTPKPTRYLLIMTPRIRDLVAAIHAASKRDPESMKALFERYNSTLLDSLF